MTEDNVLSLNAFGDLIEPKKRKYDSPPGPSNISPLKGIEVPAHFPQQIIPLTRVTSEPTEAPKSLPASPEKSKQGRDLTGSKQSNHVSSKILAHLVQTKLLHWQTKSQAEHQYLDSFFEDLISLGDELAESVMGKYGRPELGGEECTIKLVNYENPDNPDGLPRFLHNLDNCFRNECAPLFPEGEDPEIHNLIQEILGKIDKLSYQLTLRK